MRDIEHDRPHNEECRDGPFHGRGFNADYLWYEKQCIAETKNDVRKLRNHLQ